MTPRHLLQILETYYDAAPRPATTTEEIGPFTLFVKRDPKGWDYYARPRLGLDVPVPASDVHAVRERQRELGIGENIEWVHQTTPSLRDAARADGMTVEECPLLVLPGHPTSSMDIGPFKVEQLTPDSPTLGCVAGAIGAGFAGADEFAPNDPTRYGEQILAGRLVMFGAYDEQGQVVGGGSHSPRGSTTELTGIAVLPRVRRQGVGAAVTLALVEEAKQRNIEIIFLSAQNDAVARVYERVGFARVGLACIGTGGHG